MVTKVYTMKVNEAVLRFKLGKATINATFKHGVMRDKIPAKLVTSNPIVQTAIENDPRFGNAITLASTYGQEEVKEVVKTSNAVEVVEEVTTMNAALEWLKAKGVPYQSLRSVKAVKAKMEELNVSFPNLEIAE